MPVRPANEFSHEQLRDLMNDAYADYVDPFSFTEASFEIMLRTESYVPEVSFVSCEGDVPQSAWLMGLDPDNRPSEAYAITVGTRSKARRKGHGAAAWGGVREAVPARGITRVTLEVKDDNHAGLALYKSNGFNVAYPVKGYSGPPPTALGQNGCTFREVSVAEAEAVAKPICEWVPSWQNTFLACHLAGPDLEATIIEVDGRPIGCGFVYKADGYVTQIVVGKDHRRSGFARALLAHWGEKYDLSRMSLVNIPDTDIATCGLCESLGWANKSNNLTMVAEI